jgi:hypothetical protein
MVQGTRQAALPLYANTGNVAHSDTPGIGESCSSSVKFDKTSSSRHPVRAGPRQKHASYLNRPATDFMRIWNSSMPSSREQIA